MADRTDTDLLTSARAGDGAALEELLLRHQPRIYRFGMKRCRDREDASDVLQDTLPLFFNEFGIYCAASTSAVE
jgi:RNA polymerase sigma-70 factor (ECF subfamily)